jgi:hypothetical protein
MTAVVVLTIDKVGRVLAHKLPRRTRNTSDLAGQVPVAAVKNLPFIQPDRLSHTMLLDIGHKVGKVLAIEHGVIVFCQGMRREPRPRHASRLRSGRPRHVFGWRAGRGRRIVLTHDGKDT